jgi:hypothetical protein
MRTIRKPWELITSLYIYIPTIRLRSRERLKFLVTMGAMRIHPNRSEIQGERRHKGKVESFNTNTNMARQPMRAFAKASFNIRRLCSPPLYFLKLSFNYRFVSSRNCIFCSNVIRDYAQANRHSDRRDSFLITNHFPTHVHIFN